MDQGSLSLTMLRSVGSLFDQGRAVLHFSHVFLIALPGRRGGSACPEGAFRKIDLLIAAPRGMLFVEFVREYLRFLPAIGARTEEGLEVLEFFKTGAVERRAHRNLLL